jgi:hypothetical protein
MPPSQEGMLRRWSNVRSDPEKSESILRHLEETKPAARCFLNRNTRDFDVPNVRDMLEALGCRFFGRFDHGLEYIEAHLRTERDS